MVSDDDLIAAALAGDAKAHGLLARRYYRELAPYFLARVPPHVAEDMIQTTLAATVVRLERFEGRAAFRAYVFSTARRRIGDWLRKKKQWPMDPFEEDPESGVPAMASATNIHRQATANAEVQALAEVLEETPGHYRDAYWCFLLGMRRDEIAEELEVDYNTAGSRVARGKRAVLAKLRVRLGR